MNTIHRVGLTIAGVVALLVVGGAFVVQGYTGAKADAARAAAAQAAAAQQTASPTSTTDASLDPVTVYVEPMPTQPAVAIANPAPGGVVSRPDPTPAPPTPAQPTDPQPTPPVIHIIVPSPSGHGDDGGKDD
jgi:hypothetical protein